MDDEKKEAETPKSPEEDFWMTAEELDPMVSVKERFEQFDLTLPEEDELAAIVPSRYVRAYIKRTGWTFTALQKAALLANGDLPLREKCTRLKALGESAADETLRGQITAYLTVMERDFRSFCQNEDRKYIYTLEVEEGKRGFVCRGYFFDWELAVTYGKKRKSSFRVEKHRTADRTGLTQKTGGYLNPYMCPGKPAEELLVPEQRAYDGRAEAALRFSPKGEAVSLWAEQESPADEESLRQTYDPDLFENVFFPPPNPFEAGDVVQAVEKEDRYGIVLTSQEDWKAFLERQKNGLYCDFSDASIIVEFLTDDGGFSHGHINPVCLELYRPPCDSREEWKKATPRDRLLWTAGRVRQENGSLEELTGCIRAYREALKDEQKQKRSTCL